MEDSSSEALIEELRALRIRVAELEHANRERDNTPRRADTSITQRLPIANGLREDDRVRIINKVRKPVTAGSTWTEAHERLATITSVTEEQQVYVITDNGSKTWRAPNNLRLFHRREEE